MKRLLPLLFHAVLCLPSFAFARNNNPAVDFGADNTTGCLSLTTTFYDDTFFSNGDVVISYVWDFGDGTVSTAYDPAPSHTYSTPGDYTVTMSVVTLLGSNASKTKTNFIHVGNNFSINLGADTMLCGPKPFTIDATTPQATYLWSTGAATSSISTTAAGDISVIVDRYGCQAKDTINVVRNPLSLDLGANLIICDGTTVYLSAGNPGADILWSTGETGNNISVMDENKYWVNVTKDGCTLSDTINITVKPALNLNFGFERKSGCMPVDYQFTDSSTACSGSIIDWTWDFGDGGVISKAQNPVHTFTHPGTFTVRLAVTGSDGSGLSKFKLLTIAVPDLQVNLGPDTTICFGENVTLDAKNTGADFLWSSGATTQQITVEDDGDYIVRVSKDGCSVKDTIAVHTAVSVVPKWGYRANGDCLPVDVSFADSSMAYCSQTIKTWKWDFGDGTTSTQRNPVHTYSTAKIFNVKLSITTYSGNSATKTQQVKVTNAPLALDLPEEIKVCRNASAQLDAGVDSATYLWTPTAGLTASNIRNPGVTPMTNGWYSVKVSKCNTSAIDSVYITVDTSVVPAITQTGNSLSAPAGSEFEWFLNGAPVSGAVTRAIRVDRSGYYTVKVLNSTGCSGTSAPFFYVPVSGDEKMSDGFLIKLSPNPGHGVVNVLLSQIPAKPAKVSVYDAQGKCVMMATAADHVNALDMSKMLSGLYFVEVVLNSKRNILPLVLR